MDLKEYSLYRMIDRKSAIPREIQKIRKEPDWDLRHLFEAASTLGSRDDAEMHPTVIAARAKAAVKARPSRGGSKGPDGKDNSARSHP